MFSLKMCSSIFLMAMVFAAPLCNTQGHHHGHGSDHTHQPGQTHGPDHTHGPNPTYAPDHTHAPIFPGKCPDFTTPSSLDINKITDTWFGVYYIKKGYDDDHGHTIKCLREKITARVDGTIQSEFSINRDGNEIKKTFVGNPVAGNNANFNLDRESRFEHGKENLLTILGTDNTSYLVSVLCASDDINYGYVVQVFSRSPTLAPASLANVNNLLNSLNITDQLQPIEQNC